MRDAGLKTRRYTYTQSGLPRQERLRQLSEGFQNLYRRTKGEYDRMAIRMANMPMDEGRKRVIGIMAAVMAAPRLKDWNWDGRAGAPACESIVITAIGAAERILEIIDQRQGRPMSKAAGGR
jgi:hypothetical protein